MKSNMQLPPPLITVRRSAGKARRYTADGQKLPAAHRLLDIVGGPKTHALMAWARRDALCALRAEMVSALDGGRAASRELLEEALILAERRPVRTRRRRTASEAAMLREKLNAVLRAKRLRRIASGVHGASLRCGFAGTIDAVAVSGRGKFCVIVCRRGEARPEYALEAAALARAFAETYGMKPARVFVALESKAGADMLRPVARRAAWRGFASALALSKNISARVWEKGK
jgi:hypothetical protein